MKDFLDRIDRALDLWQRQLDFYREREPRIAAKAEVDIETARIKNAEAVAKIKSKGID